MTYYNPLDEFCKSPTGAVSENDNLVFRIKCESDTCALIVKKDGTSEVYRFEMIKINDYFEISPKISVGLYWYYFDVGNGNFVGKGENFLGDISRSPNCYQLSVYLSDYKVPKWLEGGIIYQIFPDRFYRAEKEKSVPSHKVLHENLSDTPIYLPNENCEVLNNDFFGGDFKGITEKLPYLKELNVTAIYLNPIFKAYSNHRYDTGDYMAFDELLGSEEDFKTLIKSADELGIKIILDGVFNHAGADSVYFNKYGRYDSVGAYQSKDSKYGSWFKFINYPDNYEAWWGIMTLPAFDKTSSEYIDFIAGKDGVLEKYTKMGIGGWRLDVVDEIPAPMVRKIRSAVKGVNENAVVIGEVWEDASNKIAYGVRREYFMGKELDSVMNYPLKNAIIECVMTGCVDRLLYVILEQIEHYPLIVLNSLMNILSTHDTYRILSSLSGINTFGMSKSAMENLTISGEQLESAKAKLKLATLMQFTLCGVPSIYYGDEIGMQGFADPLNRRFFAWGNEDLEILDWYKKLSKIRTDYSAFKDGKFNLIYCENGVMVYSRTNSESEVAIAFNAGNIGKDLCFDGKLLNLLDGKVYENKFSLCPQNMVIFVKIH